MTLTTPYSATFQVGDGETKEFPYLFEEVSESFIDVVVYNSLTGLTSTPTYTVDIDQKQVIFGDDTPAPTSDEVVCISRNTPVIQDVQFRTLHGYDAKTMENILSKIVAMIQEIESKYLTTDVLQGDPWQIDLLSSADDGATLNIDYTAKKFVKGLYFRITNGNLQVSADGSNYITMPKSADIQEFRQYSITDSFGNEKNQLQYRIGSTWYSATDYIDKTIDETLQIAQEAHDIAVDAKNTADNAVNIAETAEGKADDAITFAQAAQDAVASMTADRYEFTISAGQTTLTFDESLDGKEVELYWNGQYITKTGNWSVSGSTLTMSFGPEAGDIVVVVVNAIRQVANVASLDAHNIDPNAHANLFANIDCGLLS